MTAAPASIDSRTTGHFVTPFVSRLEIFSLQRKKVFSFWRLK